MSRPDIFLVDDERVIGQTLGIILRHAGYHVEVFDNPRRALHFRWQSPKLLLTDHNMPEISGTRLASFFRDANPEIAVMLFSAGLEESDEEWRMLQGKTTSSQLLKKPLHPHILLQEVRSAIGTPKGPQASRIICKRCYAS